MVYINGLEEHDPLDEDYEDCHYGFEFCVDPQCRDMGLCTTECELYLEALGENGIFNSPLVGVENA